MRLTEHKSLFSHNLTNLSLTKQRKLLKFRRSSRHYLAADVQAATLALMNEIERVFMK